MRKLLVTGIILSSIVTIGGATGAFAGSVHSTTSSTIEYSTPKTEKSSSTSTPAPSASTTPITSPEQTSAPATQTTPAVPAPTYVAPVTTQVETSPATSSTWSDSAGNVYNGDSAISCADGSAPVTIGHGMPNQCAYNTDGLNNPILVD